MTARRVLLVSPVFHSYWRAIEAALEAQGHEVVVHCYDAPGSLRERIENKVIHDLPERMRWSAAEDAMTRRAVGALRTARPDVVVVIKGDLLGGDWWDELERSGAARITWFYDELRRMRFTDADLQRIGPIASYSSKDVASLQAWGIRTAHVPLAHDARTPVAPVAQEAITFVGARYGSREALLRSLHDSGIPVRAYGRTWSRRPIDVLSTRQFKNPGVPTGPDLHRTLAYGVMAGSCATLNIHEDQDGFTMRTFEASGVGALQLVDRSDISRYYDVGTEALAFNNAEELVGLALRALTDTVWARRIREAGRRRTLAEHTFDHRIQRLEELWD